MSELVHPNIQLKTPTDMKQNRNLVMDDQENRTGIPLETELELKCESISPPVTVVLPVNDLGARGPLNYEGIRGKTSAAAKCSKEKVTKVAFARLALVKLWIVLIMTFGFAVVMLVASHLTHSLTLRVEAYHALYNLLVLGGCLFTMKICERPLSLKNTFGWARVELLSCLCTLLFIASLCFSVALESIQTAAHAGHQDPMHHPLPIIVLGGMGLCLNALVFCLIGGYTHHQGCFLEQRSSGVWVQRRVPQEAVQAGMRTLSGHPFQEMAGSPLQEMAGSPLPRSYQGVRGILRDISGLILAMLCAALVQWDGGATLALYVDPGFAVLSSSVLLFLSYPYGRECCQILLQTIPGNIDVQSFSARLLQEFPEIINVHHLHIWSLTPGKVIATAHVVYTNPTVYRDSCQALEQYFFEKEITKVTLQPEFLHLTDSLPSRVGSSECLLQCANNRCHNKECCKDCSKGEDDSSIDCAISQPILSSFAIRKNLSNRSRDVSVCSDYHGTCAFRNSIINLPTQKIALQQKSRSKEDVRRDKEEVPQLLRSYSCHLTIDQRNPRSSRSWQGEQQF